MKFIDLRSDTVTKPSPEMLNNMLTSELGDDVYGEDPTINELESQVAKLFQKEAALFVPSGTMSNQISLLVNTNTGDEVIVESDSHIFYYETAAASILSRVQLRCISSSFGEMPINEVKNAIRDDVYYFPKTTLICLENTHNRHGGTIISQEYIKKLFSLAKENNIKLHLDGARIWNAHKSTGIPLHQMAEDFDTLSVCFSKGMGAPVGSVFLGSKEDREKALKWRKILGGGMRQAGVLAGACLYALNHNLDKIAIDNENAREFAKLISKSNKIELSLEYIQTNIVTFKIDDKINANLFVQSCKSAGVLLSHIGNNRIRTVVHLDVDFDMLNSASKIITKILEDL